MSCAGRKLLDTGMDPSRFLEPGHHCPMPAKGPRHPSGFSLIELLIVVAIIGIIAAIAVPNLLQSKAAANEAAAISYMRNWTSAQELYHLKYGVYADADEQLVNEGLIGKGSADSHGYSFSLDNPPWIQDLLVGDRGSGHSWSDRNPVFLYRSHGRHALLHYGSGHFQFQSSVTELEPLPFFRPPGTRRAWSEDNEGKAPEAAGV